MTDSVAEAITTVAVEETPYFDDQYLWATLVYGLVMINLLANSGLLIYLP